ncbi:hypothetical protein AVEN_242474-1 [Araneus ventricosus]|uniref:Uncharacterized protein n=1 Tax=Araneus ventricosus TaxID=182803 RepID=A0A4Y2NRU3_ARAVE|nr:hypothetical protein AVEN_242474-1 [Araneus ventricosus]
MSLLPFVNFIRKVLCLINQNLICIFLLDFFVVAYVERRTVVVYAEELEEQRIEISDDKMTRKGGSNATEEALKCIEEASSTEVMLFMR